MKAIQSAIVSLLLFACMSLMASGAAPASGDPSETGEKGSSREAMQISGALTLERAIEIAVKNSPALLASEADRKMARAARKKEESRLSPVLSLTGRASSQNMPMIVTSAPDVMPQGIFQVPGESEIDLSAMLMAPIYTGGSIQNRALAARFQELAAEWESERAGRALVMGIRISYLQLQYVEESMRSYAVHIIHLEESLARSRKLYDAGKIPKVDLLRAGSDLSDARMDYNRLKAERQAALCELLASMGVSPSSEVTVDGKLSLWEFQDDRDGLVASLSSHPVMKGLEQERTKAEYELRAIRGEYVPQIYIYGMGRIMGTRTYNPSPDYGGGIVASISVSDGGLRRAMLEETMARRDLVDAKLREASLGLEKDVVTQYGAMMAAQQNVELSEAAIREAEEVLRIARMRYDAGKGIRLELSDAYWSLVSAYLKRHQAVKEYNTSIVRLRYISGK